MPMTDNQAAKLKELAKNGKAVLPAATGSALANLGFATKMTGDHGLSVSRGYGPYEITEAGEKQVNGQ